jgi:hypothetical protein
MFTKLYHVVTVCSLFITMLWLFLLPPFHFSHQLLRLRGTLPATASAAAQIQARQQHIRLVFQVSTHCCSQSKANFRWARIANVPNYFSFTFTHEFYFVLLKTKRKLVFCQ